MATSILEVRGIGPSTAVILAESGIKTAEDLATQTPAQVATIRTFSLTRASTVIANAKAVLASAETTPATPQAKLEKAVKVKNGAAKKKKKSVVSG